MKEDILSVGIDIGTSTTQLVFSNIIIENKASIVSVPMISIVEKKVIYRSEIYFTPLLSLTEIDAIGVRKIIEGEYKKAGIRPEDVDTGAVIITGETARKENASEVLKSLSGFAGEFVVATAGPDLEGIIAGKGAGAGEFSKQKGTVVANLDIGGGTTNISVFKNGDVIDTACLDIGGRLIKINKENSEVTYLSEKMKQLVERIGLKISVGSKLDKNELEKITNKMAEVLEEIVGIKEPSKELELLITNHDLRRDYEIEYLSFTGGVADCISNQPDNWFQFEDAGFLLGKSIKDSKLTKEKKILQPAETIRATVVGAGSHTTDISGSTIDVSEDVLPIKNIPILKLTEEDEKLSFDEMSKVIADKLKWFGLEDNKQLVALAIKGLKSGSFKYIQELSNSIINGMEEIINSNAPLIVIAESDMAKVLGQTLKTQLNNKKDIVCIDSIKVSDGDYIDIGKPLAEGKVVPVIVKTLLFNY
ncbi:MAG TPA: ethanolamine ammonia-lyase reactivating factor EutA [Tissierellia bacterium]|nr:ethanolamine ammonia-lyase reactivating factor EutA [Tissierellia bacterium]